ncbi:PhyR family response regulator anti-anti-sigma factor [Roseococcus pinisoli]|uniref:Response regulator n=1 Tax=Roseococcus pinisoli TaxID=2835040 RepID=A0ABS5Q9K0_9PROT|nr:response regulator [Roseococcus pinisoli]MBS7810374.1 response regulator [Roseococcus pinisoli]
MTSATELIAVLPYARRFARALTGSQAEGDALVAQAIPDLSDELSVKLALYARIARLTQDMDIAGSGRKLGRHLLLLTSLEEITLAEAAQVVGLDEEEATERLAEARAAVKAASATEVLIIEDEPVIAMDLRMLVQGCGHRVVGIAATEAEAVRLAAEKGAGLILADINLGRGGNGIQAVRRILETLDIPVIFVTAYPEQLLTAQGVEPAFVMRKPFDPVTLAIFTYQAITAGRVPLH